MVVFVLVSWRQWVVVGESVHATVVVAVTLKCKLWTGYGAVTVNYRCG